MGLFLAMSGIADVTETDVENTLRAYAELHGGKLTECPATDKMWEFLVLATSQPGRVVVLYPSTFYGWDDAAAYLSRELHVPAFSFHVHDGDLWMYVLVHKGQEVDRFNPIPEYWTDELSDAERESWKGRASVVAQHWPGIRADEIENYLVAWDLNAESPDNAYPSDEFHRGDCWQLVDFMRRLGLAYPIDDRGQACGRTFRFAVK